MKVRLKITHSTARLLVLWKETVESSLALRSVQDVAHTIREEVYFFAAENRSEAELMKEQIGRWVSTTPLDPLDGWLTYEAEIVE